MKIGLIGAGRLGICLALLIGEAGYKVIASDVREDYVYDLQNKKYNGSEPAVQELLSRSTNVEFTTDNSIVIKESDIIFTLVQTPSLEDGNYDVISVLYVFDYIKETQGISDEWDESSFEDAEKKHHVRRCFEMMYRNLLDSGRISTATIEYMQQFGVHPQICQKEVAGYIAYTDDRIQQGGVLHANDLEEFLDEMGDKYWEGADKTSERLFGKKDFTNKDFMYKTVTK